MFASVSGVSKVGYYSGNGTAGHAITTGFSPRLLIIRRVDSAESWFVLDTTRGFASGSDKFLQLEASAVQGDYDFADPTSTGFTLSDNSTSSNGSGLKYIYYAHA